MLRDVIDPLRWPFGAAKHARRDVSRHIAELHDMLPGSSEPGQRPVTARCGTHKLAVALAGLQDCDDRSGQQPHRCAGLRIVQTRGAMRKIELGPPERQHLAASPSSEGKTACCIDRGLPEPLLGSGRMCRANTGAWPGVRGQALPASGGDSQCRAAT
jgi:hypothetical protein